MGVGTHSRVFDAALVILASTTLACSSSGDGGPDASASDARRDGAHDVVEASKRKDGGVPFLSELAVSGAAASDGSAPVMLVPPFAPDVHDYYVRCASDVNALRVSMTASVGATSLLVQPTPSALAPRQVLTVSVQANDAIVAAAVNATATTEYWVRCLPPDFPQLRMTSYDDAGAPPGYYLVGNFGPVNQRPYAIVLDGRGVPVWYHLGAQISDVDSVYFESVSFYCAPSTSYEYEVHHFSPLVTTEVAPSHTVFDGHELRLLPSRDYIVISNPIRTGVDLSGVEIPLPDGGIESFGPSSTILDCNVVEFDPKTGNVVWQWVGYDHLDPVKDTVVWERAPPTVDGGPDSGTVVDPFHCNSVDVDPANNDLLVSSRDMDSIFYVDKGTGAILWKMGGKAYTKDPATYVAVPDAFHRQHDARLQPGWSADCNGGTGQISMFDDQSYLPGPARGVVYDVVVGTGEGGLTGCDAGVVDAGVVAGATVAWQYAGGTSSQGLGSFRISADGSRVVGWGEGAPNLVFTEVDVHGNKLRDFEFTDGNSSYRAIKVPTSALDLNAMRKTAGLP